MPNSQLKVRGLSKTSKLELTICSLVISTTFAIGICDLCKFSGYLTLNNVMNRLYYGKSYYGK